MLEDHKNGKNFEIKSSDKAEVIRQIEKERSKKYGTPESIVTSIDELPVYFVNDWKDAIRQA